MKYIPHVALLIETSREFARGLLRGIAHFQKEHGPWSIYFEPHGLGDPPPAWLETWRGDGILARIGGQRMADVVLKAGIPAVDVNGAIPDLGITFVGVDNRPVAKLAFEHLLECGLRRFAYCGTPRGENRHRDLRCDFFVEQVHEAGYKCDCLLRDWAGGRSKRWEQEQNQISSWLRELPKPIGLMTCDDETGQQVLDACRRAELSVPDQVAVIGVNNDSTICNLCTPSLTSIDDNPSRIGYEAAKLLTEQMNGKHQCADTVLLGPPRGVASRQSTDIVAIEDEDVASAVRFIREQAVQGIQANEVLARFHCSPSTLERRFKKTLDRTIKAEITRVRLVKAKLLLSETDFMISEIAFRSGFSEPKYFCEVFRKHEGMTATAYRKLFRNEQLR